MSYLKIWAVLFLLVFIVSWAFYTWVITKIRLLIWEANTWFLSFVPTEALAVVGVIIFSLLMGLAYAIFRE